MKKIANVLFDADAILWMHYDSEALKVRVHFEDGSDLFFEGDEAMQIWREFDNEGDWRDE